jgi:hypothetical protein
VTPRMGVGGTMASSTPVTSPVSPTDMSMLEPPLRSASTKPVLIPQTRNPSFSRKREDPPKTLSHSRNASGASIRTAIRLPKPGEKEKESYKMRKDSIEMPHPLGSCFGLERSMSIGAERQGESEASERYAVGEAI